MRILNHKKIISTGNDVHHSITIDWFDQEWKILINDNCVKKTTTIYLWDKREWRAFDNRTQSEAIIHKAILENKIVKLKYKVQ